MKLTFLGTNGWYDTATGNTPSALLETSEFYIIFDAGFGLAKLNEHIHEDKPVFLFISHFHIDHICGLHTLPKLKLKKLTILGQVGLKKYLNFFVNHPFAMPFAELPYPTELVELTEGDHSAPFEFSCLPLQHADPALGYRLKVDGKTITYCSDTAVCDNDRLLGEDSDLFIHECAFAPGYSSAWGHTNPEQAAELALRARTKKLVLTHFGASDYDRLEARQKAEQVARQIFPDTVAARDGLEIEI